MQESGERRPGIGSLHEVLANQKTVKTGAVEPEQIGVRANPGFSNGDALLGYSLDQFE